MAMSMQELFYGTSEPAYFIHYGRQNPLPYSNVRDIQVPNLRSHRAQCATFDLMVPMCCARCQEQVRGSLYALRGVQDVVCDPHNQRVTIAGCLEPALAVRHLRRVKKGPTFCSQNISCAASRYVVSSYQKSHGGQQDNRDRRGYVQLDTNEQRSHYDHSHNSSSTELYTRSFCPAHRHTTDTHFASVPNPTIATREDWDCWTLIAKFLYSYSMAPHWSKNRWIVYTLSQKWVAYRNPGSGARNRRQFPFSFSWVWVPWVCHNWA